MKKMLLFVFSLPIIFSNLVYGDGGSCISGNCMNGQGTFKWSENEMYVGQFKNEMRNGQGTMTWPNGDKYTGQWKDDKMHGMGTLTYADGQKDAGRFENNVFAGKCTAGNCKDGKGTLTWRDGKYIGQFKDGKKHGKGTIYNSNGSIIEDGYYKNGEYYGKDNPEPVVPEYEDDYDYSEDGCGDDGCGD